MAINPAAGRILQAMSRLQEVICKEFDDLSPQEITFVLCQVAEKIRNIGGFNPRPKQGD